MMSQCRFRLFTFVDESRFETGVYPLLIDLLNQFNPNIGEEDPDLSAEVELFLDRLLETEVMNATQQVLVEWGEKNVAHKNINNNKILFCEVFL